MRVERLPFTVYDIVGYLIPGLSFLALIIISWDIAEPKIDVLSYFDNKSAHTTALFFILYLILSYISGHIIGFLSSETSEKIFVGFIGYPSDFLINEYKYNAKYLEKSTTQNIVKKTNESRFFVIIFYVVFFPYAVALELLNTTNVFKYFTRPLGDNICILLRHKFKREFKIDFDSIPRSEWFKIVEHYSINNNNQSLHRMYNYMTIYGFLRNMSFCFYFISLFIISYVIICPARSNNLNIQIFYSAMFMIVSFVLLMGFGKFFRRYSQEAIMSFVTYKNSSPGHPGDKSA